MAIAADEHGRPPLGEVLRLPFAGSHLGWPAEGFRAPREVPRGEDLFYRDPVLRDYRGVIDHLSGMLHARQGTAEALAPRIVSLVDESVAVANVVREVAAATASAASQRYIEARVQHGLGGAGRPRRVSRRGRPGWRPEVIDFGPGGPAGFEAPDRPSEPPEEWLAPMSSGDDDELTF